MMHSRPIEMPYDESARGGRGLGQVNHVRHLTGFLEGFDDTHGFRRDALLEFPTLPPGDLERLEQLEQLRWLENGYRIRIVETEYDAISVDVPADIERVEKLLRANAS